MDDDQLIQQRAVTRILRCQNHYEVLNITRNANNENIVNAYKNQARLVHPDKNHHPQAEDAMKKVTKARETLTDPMKRMEHDLSLRPEIHQQRFHSNKNMEANENDDDAFSPNDNWWSTKFRIYILVSLPVILLVLMPALVSWLTPHSVYSLTPDAKFAIRRRTMAGKIPYYVTKDFSAKLQKYYNGSLGCVEKDVKNAYKTKLERACNREKIYKQDALNEALNSPNHRYWYERVEQAKSLQTPSCEKLKFLTVIFEQSNENMSKLWKFFYSFYEAFAIIL